MTVQSIRLYPNPILREVCAPVPPEEIGSPKIQTLVADMIETMYAYEGTVGLAAPQVGTPVQIFVMDSTTKTTRDRLHVMINPEIQEKSRWKFSREGCLSFPDYLVTVKRARKITVSWWTPQGEQRTDTFFGLRSHYYSARNGSSSRRFIYRPDAKSADRFDFTLDLVGTCRISRFKPGTRQSGFGNGIRRIIGLMVNMPSSETMLQ